MDEAGNEIRDDTLLILLIGHSEPVSFTLPRDTPDRGWQPVLDTRNGTGKELTVKTVTGKYMLASRSLALLKAE